ncbi:MAG: class I SAM-dependent methyltransferase [Denitromonas halophila]|nr:MAG: class I SAM-dependent methyltransferase [Denitromonas halophila]
MVRISDFYNKIFNFNGYYREKFVASFAASLPDGSRVLDAGAGTCKYKHYFDHCDYKAQDFAKYEGSEHRYGELDYICDILEIPEGDGSFDAVVCLEVLEHVPRPDKVVQELSRLLRPGGRIAVSAPLGSGVHMAPYHYYGGFSPFWYKHFFEAVDFVDLSIRQNGGFFRLYGQESRRIPSLLVPSRGALALLLFPIKVVLFLLFGLFFPVMCTIADRLVKTDSFTAGYFVVARKR